MATRQTKFNKLWLAEPKYRSWLQIDESSDRNAKCRLCMCSIQLSNMGKRALQAHRKTKKHIACESNLNSSSSMAMSSWIVRHSSSSSSISSDTLTQGSTPGVVATSSSTYQQKSGETGSSVLDKQVELNANVAKAEILWILNLINKHQSYNSMKNISALFSTMFHDSEIAQTFSCSPSKCSYITCFGLAPYFHDQLLTLLKEVPFYSVSFDESFNTVTKNEQMDLNVRFWDTEQQLIVNRYLGSHFLGHATSKDLLAHFKEGTSKLDSKKIVQISMDGPNVNLKFLKDFVDERALLEPALPSLIDIGPCALHGVHGANCMYPI